ncbi:MAG: thioredoxin family protein [Dehalococcoidia bacterium]
MVAERELVVPAELFAAAKSYEAYVASVAVNREKFADNLAKASVPDDLAARLQALAARPDGPKRLLVFGEDWCPDVYRGLPVAKRIADAAGIELRVLERDQHLDAFEPYKNGEFLSIPVYVFIDAENRVIARWIERPALANEQMREAMSPIFGPSGTRQLTERLGRAPTDEEKEAARVDAQRRYDAFQASSPYWAGWRAATVVEVVELLERAPA